MLSPLLVVPTQAVGASWGLSRPRFVSRGARCAPGRGLILQQPARQGPDAPAALSQSVTLNKARKFSAY